MSADWKLFLIRHAQSANNAKPDSERVPDPGITELGVEQSKLLASFIHRFEPTLLYCSPFLRSLQTLKPSASALGLMPIIRQDLFEQGGCHRGFETGKRFAEPGMTRRELETHYSGWELDPRITEHGWNPLKEYETTSQARLRAHEVCRWFDNEPRHSTHRVAMMIHADFKVRLRESFLGIEDLDSHVAEPINTSISCLIKSNGRWQLDFWNHFHHLPDHLVSS